MASSKTRIFNLALHNLGISDAIQDTNQMDPRAIVLNNYYEFARNTVLEGHEWSFANAYKELSVSCETPMDPNYQYAFTYPNDCIAPRAIINPYDKKEKKFDPSIGSNGDKVILTNHNPCILRYTKRIDNETLFTSAFADALAYFLAYKTAISLTGSENKKKSNLQDYHMAIRQAIVCDARKAETKDQDDKDFTDSRY